ncbi:MAG: uroporphyrinogen-III C-methyltransferase, partial [Candidatus Acidiferrum sp.]
LAPTSQSSPQPALAAEELPSSESTSVHQSPLPASTENSPAPQHHSDHANPNPSFRAKSAERGIPLPPSPNSPLPTPHSPLPRVFLIGAGPGDPALLTVKAFQLLQSSNVVLHDSLVSPEILALIPPTAQRIDVGKRAGFRLLTQSDINAILIAAAAKHKIVVRLKGGDPLLFGRAAEEIDALRAAKIEFEIVPGISAAFGAAAAAQVSLTDRRLASHVLFTTYSRSPETNVLPILGITSETTVVVYMPGPDYSGVSHWLAESGIVAETPCLVISKASQREQSLRLATVSQLASLLPLPAPALLIVGRVVSHSACIAAPADWLNQLAPELRKELSIS